jgi:hypothetical protein
VGGDPFPIDAPSSDARSKLLDRIEEVVDELKEMPVVVTNSAQLEITAEMVKLRGMGFELRKTAYLEDRINDQIGWYGRRSVDHRQLAKRWLVVTVAASAFGIVMGVLRFLNVFDIDLLGLASGVASSAIAWNQANQHRVQATSYALAERELSLIRDRIPEVLEPVWALFVSDSEDAISREHTMWLARRGHPRVPRSKR